MRSNGIVVQTPCFDDDLRFATTAEPFDAQAFVAELAVEALVGTVLPWLARVDQCGLDVLGVEPFEDRFADELRSMSERR